MSHVTQLKTELTHRALELCQCSQCKNDSKRGPEADFITSAVVLSPFIITRIRAEREEGGVETGSSVPG